MAQEKPNGTPTARLTVGIVGGGIGGVAAAIALKRAGLQVTVFEASRQLGEIGAAVSSSPNATKILRRWGSTRELVAGDVITFYKIYDLESGALVSHIDYEYADGDEWWGCHRKDLHAGLVTLAHASEGRFPIKFFTGARVDRIDTLKGQITLANGTVNTFDLVIGADGIHSVAQNAVLQEASSSTELSEAAYRCLIPSEKVAEVPELKFLTDQSGFSIWPAGQWRLAVYTCRNKSFINIVAIFPAPKGMASEDWSASGNVQDMIQRFEDRKLDPKALNLLRLADECKLWALRDREPLFTWTNASTALLGDACHACLPHQAQGAAQAIEDADCLGTLFEGVTDASAIPEILHIYETIRVPRAHLIQMASRAQARPNLLPPWQRGISKAKLPVHQQYFNWYYDGQAETLRVRQYLRSGRFNITVPPRCPCPFGVFSSPQSIRPRIGVLVGDDWVIELAFLYSRGIFSHIEGLKLTALDDYKLDGLKALPQTVIRDIQCAVRRFCSIPMEPVIAVRSYPAGSVTMHKPLSCDEASTNGDSDGFWIMGDRS